MKTAKQIQKEIQRIISAHEESSPTHRLSKKSSTEIKRLKTFLLILNNKNITENSLQKQYNELIFKKKTIEGRFLQWCKENRSRLAGMNEKTKRAKYNKDFEKSKINYQLKNLEYLLS